MTTAARPAAWKRIPRHWWIIAGAAAALFGCCSLAACAGVAVLAYQHVVPYSREQFNRRFTGASMDEVRWTLGGPDGTSADLPGEGEGYWTYKGRTLNPVSGQRDYAAFVWWEHGRVVQITYSP